MPGHQQRQLHQLDELEAAATHVAHCCRDVRATLAPLPGDLQQSRAAELQAAVARLRHLLDDFALATHRRTNTPSPVAASSTSDGHLPDRNRTLPLLELPGELLSRVARLVGKEARLACQQLRDAYGCPGTILRQPVAEGCVVADTSNLERRVDRLPVELGPSQIGASLLRALHALYPSHDCWDVPRQFSRRWPGQVTRLELSDDFNPNLRLLRALHSALPHLRELTCAWPNFADDCGRMTVPDHELPCFTALTALNTLCSVAYGVEFYGGAHSLGHMFNAAQVVVLAPSLRSLEADLSWQTWDEQLLRLTRLSHVTDLCFIFDDPFEPVPWEEPVACGPPGPIIDILASAATRLRSLTLVDYFTCAAVEPGKLVQSMSCLTSLALLNRRGAPTSCLPEWEHLPQLQQLSLGCGSQSWWWVDSDFGDVLHSSMHESSPPPGLSDVSLPLADFCDTYTVQQLQEVLGQLQAQCTGLTRLVLGFNSTDPDNEPLEPLLWLAPVGGMRQLQRLALRLPGSHMGQLECLSSLPLLSTLWLHLLCNADLAASTSTVSVLGRLAAVRDLTLLLTIEAAGGPAPESCNGLVSGLLAAASQMPLLEVLDTLGLVGFSSSCQLWEALTACPQQRLRQLVLRTARGDCWGGRQWCVALEAVAAAVSAALPETVHVEMRHSALVHDDVAPWALERPSA